MVLRLALIFSLLSQTVVYPVYAADNALLAALKQGKTFARIVLLASDEELPHISQGREEAEHALEQPMLESVEGFWRKRWEALKNPAAALDLTRSFQNLGRLLRLSKDFASPWLRKFLISAATMFGITHGSEVVTGVSMGVVELLRGNWAESMAWFGLALPGLYDIGCFIGAGILVLRPTRNAFQTSLDYTIWAIGSGATHARIPQLLRKVFDRQEVQDRLQAALERNPHLTLDVEASEDGVFVIDIQDSAGVPFARLTLEEDEGELVARTLEVKPAAMPGNRTPFVLYLPNWELRGITKGLGWNLRGVLLQVSRLVRRDREDLIEREKTFVSEVEEVEGRLVIHFREKAVALTPRWRLKRQCPQVLAEAGLAAP
ncbi:hypothetical protein K2X33_12020 [bacterium]|nr:hypothetical protein [bacterium]